MRPTKKECRNRELAVVAENREIYGTVSTEKAYALITADRLRRWAPEIAITVIPEKIKKWSSLMTSVHGPDVLMYHEVRAGMPGYAVDWITALMIVMYGEAEYFWPEELGEDDIKRAYSWMNGKKVPGIITYIPKGG